MINSGNGAQSKNECNAEQGKQRGVLKINFFTSNSNFFKCLFVSASIIEGLEEEIKQLIALLPNTDVTAERPLDKPRNQTKPIIDDVRPITLVPVKSPKIKPTPKYDNNDDYYQPDDDNTAKNNNDGLYNS